MREEVLRLEHIFVKKQGEYVLEDFWINVYKGEMVVLYGLSGSGVDVVGEILAGQREIERGRLYVGEKNIDIKKNILSETQGIFVVQHSNNLIPDLTVAENLFMGGKKPFFSISIGKRKQEKQAHLLMKKFGFEIDVHRPAKKLLYHEEIIVKLIKAYIKGAKVVLVNDYMEMLHMGGELTILQLMNKLREDGIGILWINQRIDIAPDLADRIIIVREGRNVRNMYKEEYSKNQLLRLASNRMAQEDYRIIESKSEDIVFEAEALTGKFVEKASFSVKKGQVFGISSLDANSMQELQQIMCGEVIDYRGSMYLNGNLYMPENLESAVKGGVNHVNFMVPQKHGVDNLDVMDNLMLENYWHNNAMFTKEKLQWKRYMEMHYRKRHPDWTLEKWGQLSVEQKKILLFEKCLYQSAKVHIFVEPFIQYSYGMIEEIQKIFEELIEKDKTIILFSMNDQEIRKVCKEIYTLV